MRITHFFLNYLNFFMRTPDNTLAKGDKINPTARVILYFDKAIKLKSLNSSAGRSTSVRLAIAFS